jgi:anti-sigma regulatory factor (Ser/Thr protein kinase)
VELTRTFERSAAQIPVARQYVRAALAEWGIDAGPDSLLDDVVLVTSELFTNAVLHGEGDVELTVGVDRDNIRVVVVDRGSTGVPLMARTPPIDELTGRGLRIVDRLAVGWGSRRHHRGGTEVWMEIPRNGDGNGNGS